MENNQAVALGVRFWEALDQNMIADQDGVLHRSGRDDKGFNEEKRKQSES